MVTRVGTPSACFSPDVIARGGCLRPVAISSLPLPVGQELAPAIPSPLRPELPRRASPSRIPPHPPRPAPTLGGTDCYRCFGSLWLGPGCLATPVPLSLLRSESGLWSAAGGADHKPTPLGSASALGWVPWSRKVRRWVEPPSPLPCIALATQGPLPFWPEGIDPKFAVSAPGCPSGPQPGPPFRP